MKQRDADQDQTKFNEIHKPDTNQITQSDNQRANYKSTSHQVAKPSQQEIERVFNQIDVDKSKTVDVQELPGLLRNLGFSHVPFEKVKTHLNTTNINSLGSFSHEQFVDIVNYVFEHQ